MNTPATSRATRPFFDAVAVEMHGHRKKLEFFLTALERLRTDRKLLPSDIAILEVGCSNGRNVALPLAEHGYIVTGLDVHEPSIAAANAAATMTNARFFAIELSDFSSDRPHDVLILSDVLEHVEQPLEMIREGLKHMAPDAMVLISIPNGYGPFEIESFLVAKGVLMPLLALRDAMRWLKRRLGRPGNSAVAELLPYNWESGHVQFFTRRSLRRLLATAGLHVSKMANGCLFGGEVTSYFHQYWTGLTSRSLQFADHLPAALVSTWYFECERAALPDRSNSNDGLNGTTTMGGPSQSVRPRLTPVRRR